MDRIKLTSMGEGLGLTTWPSPCPASPIHNDDLLSEILLRLSPLPSSLPRASVVCTRWHRIITDPSFLRRYRAHHWKPFGVFLCSHQQQSCEDDLTFTSISDAVPPDDDPLSTRVRRECQLHGGGGGGGGYTCWEFCGCRHGRVLLVARTPHSRYGLRQLQVWNPILGERHLVPVPPPQLPGVPDWNKVSVRAAVTCVAADKGPFQVALAWDDGRDRPLISAYAVYACVYSSDTGEWGDVVSVAAESVFSIGFGNVLIGNSLYWILWGPTRILELDLGSHNLAVIEVPSEAYDAGHRGIFLSTLAKDGELSLVVMSHELEARVWVRTTIMAAAAGSDDDGVAGWMLRGTIQLGKLLSLRSVAYTYPVYPRALWLAGDDNLLFVWTHRGVFMVHLESMRFEKIPFCHHGIFHPFTHLYVPGSILVGRQAAAGNNCKGNVKRALHTKLERNRKRGK